MENTPNIPEVCLRVLSRAARIDRRTILPGSRPLAAHRNKCGKTAISLCPVPVRATVNITQITFRTGHMNEIPQARQQLLEMIEHAGSIPGVQPLPCSPWLAKSLLQKSIRRGLVMPAYRAAFTLLQSNPRQLWSRLCVIAFEDVGFGDIDSVAFAVAAADAKVRAQTAPDWQIAAALITRLCNAPKCRATDDLASVAAFHPSLEQQRAAFAELPQERPSRHRLE